MALRLAGLGPHQAARSSLTPLDFLGALARGDGSIEYSPGLRSTPAWTTGQALLGLIACPRLLAQRPAEKAGSTTHRIERSIGNGSSGLVSTAS